MLNLEEVRGDKRIAQLIKRTEEFLDAQGYTDHGSRHLNIVSQRASMLARKLGFDNDIEEYAKVAGWTHDMANFLSRTNHHYFGSLLFHDLFNDHEDQNGVTIVMEAIANHDKEEAHIAHPVTALLILADKSDVHRTRVKEKNMGKIKTDIHDRVNYSVTECTLKVAKGKKIVLALTLDENFTSIIDYFAIFLDRMKYCEQAATYLGYIFKLEINGKDMS